MNAYSRKLLEEHKISGNVVYATTNYHVFRSGLWAAQAGLPAEGISRAFKPLFPIVFGQSASLIWRIFHESAILFAVIMHENTVFYDEVSVSRPLWFSFIFLFSTICLFNYSH